jgi:protein O-GlcNAc transferase
MKKIISFGLWGENPRYTIGALKNADLAKEIYPDWICRYYTGKSTPIEIIKSLYEKDNTEIIIMNEQGDWNGMFWRFFPASDIDVEVMISRDADSRLSQREKTAVDEWLGSDKGFHIMRDHPAHGTEILGGMWGAKSGSIPQMKPLILEYSKGNFWQVDQNFLKEKIYPIVKDNSYVHDEFFEKKPFPTIRKDGIDKNGNPTDFIGEPVNEKDERIW